MAHGIDIVIVAGEASGDLLGAHLLGALNARLDGLKFFGIGGPRMLGAGCDSRYPMERLAVRGYVEVVRHYWGITSIRRDLLREFRRRRPRLFIGIDAPDFNLQLEQRLRTIGVPTVHYVSPSVWAWRGWRMHGIRRAVNHMLALFPFEEALYRSAGIPVTYVGHPLADLIPLAPQRAVFREQLRIDPQRRVVALLPGSRQSEVRYMAADMVATAQRLSQHHPETVFLVPLASRETLDIFNAALYRAGAGELALRTMSGHAHAALGACDLAIVASGTATLEAMLFKRPMIITYKMAPLTWQIMQRMRYQPYVGLPNILAGEFVVPELLQDQATPERMAVAALEFLDDRARCEAVSERFTALHATLRRGTAEAAANVILPMLHGA
jgi:lipid-A-disaccharide synthase